MMIRQCTFHIIAIWMVTLPLNLVVSFVVLPQQQCNYFHTNDCNNRGNFLSLLSFTRTTTTTSKSKTKATITTRHMATVNFQGTANSEVCVIPPPNTPPSRSLHDFLMASDSNRALLGTDDTSLRSDGLWDCRQPPIGWFGLELRPIFVNKLERHSITNYDNNNNNNNSGIEDEAIIDDIRCFVTVTIVSARTDIATKTSSNAGKNNRPSSSSSSIVSKLMQRCTFMGKSALSHKNAPDGEGWILSFDFDLTLQIPLPRLLPLPPGFNSIGSRIVRTTCNQRVEQTLFNVRDAYLEWASLPEEKE